MELFSWVHRNGDVWTSAIADFHCIDDQWLFSTNTGQTLTLLGWIETGLYEVLYLV